MARSKLIVFIIANVFLTASRGAAGLAQTTPTGNASISAVRVGVVKDIGGIDEVGCSLQFPADYRKHNERYVVKSDENNAVMNIDGKDRMLKLVSHREPKGAPRKGDRSTWNYADKETKVRIDFVVTRVCDPNDESCEVTWYDATITVTRKNGKGVVNVKGVCGS
jgi:hypothetical protein